MELIFKKYHGAGNDFILIDDRPMAFPCKDADLIARLCHRQLGVGADGLLLIQPSEKSDVKMRIFNADGLEAKMCGNGVRCVAHFLGRKTVTIETLGQIIRAELAHHQVCVDMGSYLWKNGLELRGTQVYLVDTGVPHAVVFVNDLEEKDFVKAAREIRFLSHLQPEGANVNFAKIQDNKIYVRTYERGVEDETLSCGTGNAAVAIAATKIHLLSNPIICFPMSGEILKVEVCPDKVYVTGPATQVFEGKINI